MAFIGSSLQGYFLGKPLPIVSRALFFAAAITLITPGYLTDAIGAGLGLMGYAAQRLAARSNGQALPCPDGEGES